MSAQLSTASNNTGSRTSTDPESSDAYFDGHFANLIPLNKTAKNALQEAAEGQPPLSDFHRQFFAKNEDGTYHFALSLTRLPELPHMGWRIGRGRQKLHRFHLGVDLLLRPRPDDDVTGIHARFLWRKGTAGFFISTDAGSGRVLLNGMPVHEHAVIAAENTILIGECLFRLAYVDLSVEHEEQYQLELRDFLRTFHQDENAFVVPTPQRERDWCIGDWLVHWAISKGTFGTVYAVTHRQDGRPAAGKHILQSKGRQEVVEREVDMARKISKLEHPFLACPFEIFEQKQKTYPELLRLRTNLGPIDAPILPNDIETSYMLISPLCTTTLAHVYASASDSSRMTMFHQLLQAVAYLHENGITHRDIKPANILVLTMQPQPLIQLTDFGCASDEAGWVYDDGKPVGTVPFLAPEQVSGTRYGRGIDVWASGVVGLVLSGFDIGGRLLPRTDGVLEGMLGKLGDSGGKLGACLTEMLRTNATDRTDAATASDIVGKLLRGGGGVGRGEDDGSNVGNKRAKKG